MNVIDNYAQGEISDDEDEEGNTAVIHIKAEIYKPLQESKNSSDMKQKKATLLEQALSFREQNPEKWQQSQLDSERIVNDSYGLYEDDPFLEAYYKRLAELKIEASIMEERRKTLPATISVQLEYNNARRRSSGKNASNPVETYADIASDGISIFDDDSGFFDRFKSHKDDERGREPELLIKVSKGKNLQNALKNENTRLKNCRLKCKFYPDSLKHGPKLKTAYIHCSLKGTTRWNHVFVLKGFNASQLAAKHVVLELVGKTDEGKVVLGEAVLAGRQAQICQKECDMKRSPTPGEFNDWEEALRKPGSTTSITLNMTPSRRIQKDGFTSMLAEKMKTEMENNRSSFNHTTNKHIVIRSRTKK